MIFTSKRFENWNIGASLMGDCFWSSQPASAWWLVGWCYWFTWHTDKYSSRTRRCSQLPHRLRAIRCSAERCRLPRYRKHRGIVVGDLYTSTARTCSSVDRSNTHDTRTRKPTRNFYNSTYTRNFKLARPYTLCCASFKPVKQYDRLLAWYCRLAVCGLWRPV